MRLARLLAALTLAATSLGLGASSQVLAEAGDYISVKAADDYFDAEVTRVPVGTTIEWRNVGRNAHTVTADDGSFDSGNMAPGAEYSHAFTVAGVYRYYCVYHGARGGVGMAGIGIHEHQHGVFAFGRCAEEGVDRGLGRAEPLHGGPIIEAGMPGQ